MNIIVKEERNVQEWQKCLDTFSATPFMASAWVESFRTSTRHPIYFRFMLGDDTIGLIAGLALKPSSFWLKKIDNPIFFFSGPALSSAEPAHIQACISSLIAYAKRQGYTSLTFRSWDYPYKYEIKSVPFYQETREEYIIDLRGEFSEVQKNIRKKTREKIRKAQREGLTFHEGDSPELLQIFNTLLEQTKAMRQAKGYKDYSYYYIPFLNQITLSKLLENNGGRIFYIKREDRIICMQLRVTYARRAFGILSASNQEGYKYGANPFILFCQMELFKKEGIEFFNLGGVPAGLGAPGLTYFKESFGAKKHSCVGGTTAFLQGAFFNLLYQLYHGKIFPATLFTNLEKDLSSSAGTGSNER